MRKKAIVFVLLIAPLALAQVRRFSENEIITRDVEDFRLFSPPPGEYKAATIWDGVDEILLRPIPDFFSFKASKKSKNVNALDEVPDSSWYTKRKVGTILEIEKVKKGACEVPLDPSGPFEVISAKPDGFNPGFLVKAPNGKKYFFKFDQHELQPERMSSAEVIGSFIYHAIGFTVPCYEILYFDKSALKLMKNSTMKNKKGEKIPMTEEFLSDSFRFAKKSDSRKVRAVSSLLLEGSPLGPWRYSGTLGEDPNDVISHEERREVRAGYVLASWISHFDTRDQNTLSTWIAGDDKKSGYVRHNILDFGDSIGNIADSDAISRRLGYSHYVDFPYFFQDLITLGLIERPWDKVAYGPAGPALGYFNLEHFVPDNWKPGYPNPAFQEMQEADGAWMARLISGFRNEHLSAIVENAKIQNSVLKKEILKNLIGRRDKLLHRWLGKLSPLSEPEIMERKQKISLCLSDLSLYADLIPDKKKTFRAHTMQLKDGSVGESLKIEFIPNENKVCVMIPPATSESSSYQVVEIQGASTVHPDERPLRVHYFQKDSKWQIAGLERVE